MFCKLVDSYTALVRSRNGNSALALPNLEGAIYFFLIFEEGGTKGLID